jgi:hypothetical protein
MPLIGLLTRDLAELHLRAIIILWINAKVLTDSKSGVEKFPLLAGVLKGKLSPPHRKLT